MTTTISRIERDAVPDASGKPGRDCPLCPRLKTFREEWRRREPDWFNAPVASFGPRSARLLIVGLAPGLRGANRTGRPFTGDFAGVLLYDTLHRFGFSEGHYQARPDDGVRLVDCMLSNAVRCAPPGNKPTPEEENTCRRFLTARIRTLPRLKAMTRSTERSAGDRAARCRPGARRTMFPHPLRTRRGPCATTFPARRQPFQAGRHRWRSVAVRSPACRAAG